MAASIFYQGKQRKWETLQFGEDYLGAYLTAIRYLREGYTVGLSAETAQRVRELDLPLPDAPEGL